MVVKVYLFETRGGRLLTEVLPLDVNWSGAANAGDDVSITIDLLDTVEGARDWRSLATAWKHSAAVDVNGRLYGGPIMPVDASDDDSKLTIKARGLRVMLDRMRVVPASVLARDPALVLTRPDGLPDPALDTVIDGCDLGTIGMKIAQQAFGWPGWSDIPIVWPAARVGSSTRTYQAVDLKSVDEALTDLSQVRNGPDFRFQLRWRDADSFEWVFESGTEAQPRLQSPDVFEWEVGSGSGLQVKQDPSRMASLSWSVAGRDDDVVLARMRYDPILVDRGFPLLMGETDASQSITDPATLDAWNAERLRTARKPWEFWTFNIAAAGSPKPSEYNTGDLIDVIVTSDAPVIGGYVPPGTYRRRIAGLSGTLGDWIQVTCGEYYDDQGG